MSGHGKQHSLANIEDHSDGLEWTSLQTTFTANSASWEAAGTVTSLLSSNGVDTIITNPSNVILGTHYY